MSEPGLAPSKEAFLRDPSVSSQMDDQAIEIPTTPDVLVIGAGPAGMAAARACAQAGLVTVILDEQAAPGGQIYRSISHTPLQERHVLGADYWHGLSLVQGLHSSAVHRVAGAAVWNISPEREVAFSKSGRSYLLRPRRIIVATGAQERPFPIEGWTLPGVMTAGGAQILLKSSGVVPAGKTVLAGCGPLLWLLASQLLAAGGRVDLILDTTPKKNRASAWPHVVEFLTSPYALKGLGLWLGVRRKVRVVTGVTQLRAESDGQMGRLARVHWHTSDGTAHQQAVDTLLLHQGVVPQTNLAMAIGVPHRWDEVQLCWQPEVDDFGRSAVEGVWLAGDGAGIGGAQAAACRGQLAALSIIRELAPSALTPDETTVRAELARWMRGRAFLDHWYRPADAMRIPTGDTVVCRCEEITAQQVVDTVGLGCTGPNQMKSFLRCGMGPCQGRLCSLTVTEIMAQQRGVSPAEVGHYRLRPPVKPISVGELATLPQDEAATKAVVRL